MNMKVLNLPPILNGFLEVPPVWCVALTGNGSVVHLYVNTAPRLLLHMFQLQALLNLMSVRAVTKLWFVLFFPLVFILAFCPRLLGQAACFSVIDGLFSEAEGDAPGRVNGQANKPPLHRCTSWSQCLGSVWLGGWWGRGTGLRSPPLWAPSAEFGRKSDTCCLLPEAACGSLLQEEENCN